MESSLSVLGVAFTVGLLSSLHCVGMCGGIAGVLTMTLPGEVRENRPSLLLHLIAFNTGRIATYIVAGGMLGAFGTGVLQVAGAGYTHLLLQGMGAAVLGAIGLYIAGWLPNLALVEGAGGPIWRHLEPLGRRFMPAHGPGHAFAYGLIWGWLPCGLVYSSLLWAFTAGGAVNGMTVMAGFGLGTLPAMMGTGLFSRQLADLGRLPYLRQAVGSAIILVAVLSLMYSHSIGDAICSAYGVTP